MSYLQHRIDPLVDFAFKRIFANPHHPDVLIHFLNAILRPTPPILEVTLAPTEELPQYAEDRVVIVDILAKDASGAVYHVEMQRRRHGGLEERVVYGWARQLATQLREGSEFTSLNHVFSIWVLEEPLAEDLQAPLDVFAMTNARGRPLGKVGQIVLVQPARFRDPPAGDLAPADAWLYFFNEGGDALDLPAPLATHPVMHEVFEIMSTIANNAETYAAYQRRLDAWRVEAAWKRDREEAHRAKEEAHRAKEEAHRAKEEAVRAKEEAVRAKEEALAALEAERRQLEEAVRAQEEAVRAQEEERRAKEEERHAKEEAVRAQEEERRAKEEAQARADALALEIAELRRRMEGA